MRPFHLAIPVHDLNIAKQFYQNHFGCTIGRETNEWVDLNFFGHQVSLHFKPEETSIAKQNKVDGKAVPVRHFGIVLEWNEWHKMAEHLKNLAIDFIIAPYIRFKDQVGEQATMFFCDPSGNAIELKAFQDIEQLFAPYNN